MVAEHTAVVGRLVLVFAEPEEGHPFVAEEHFERPSCLVLVCLEKFCQFDFSVELD